MPVPDNDDLLIDDQYKASVQSGLVMVREHLSEGYAATTWYDEW